MSAHQSAAKALDRLLADKTQIVRDVESRVPVLNANVRSSEMRERLGMAAGTHAEPCKMPVEASTIRAQAVPLLQLT